eukprot:29960-Prymnesium_polylepis.1
MAAVVPSSSSVFRGVDMDTCVKLDGRLHLLLQPMSHTMPPRTTRLAPLLLLLAINACSSLVPRAAVPLRFCDATATRSVKANCAASYDDRGRRIIPFATAREAVQRLSLRDEQEWCRWVEDNKPGITSHRRWYLPDHPDEVYIEEWLSWDDWLGVMRPYDEA